MVSADDDRKAADAISIQLWTLRRLLDQNVDETLAALAAIGYRQVEVAGTHGLSAVEFRTLLDRHGLRATSGHVSLQPLQAGADRVLDEAITLGHRYLVCSSVPPESRTGDGMGRVAECLNRVGEEARQRGLRLGYHNHDFEFVEGDSGVLFDILTGGTNPELLHLEMDLYWVVRAGIDPATLLQRHAGRVLQVHVKDMAPGGGFADLGTGQIDYSSLLTHASNAGALEYIVEHDASADPLRSAQAGWEYLRRWHGRTHGRASNTDGSQSRSASGRRPDVDVADAAVEHVQ